MRMTRVALAGSLLAAVGAACKPAPPPEGVVQGDTLTPAPPDSVRRELNVPGDMNHLAAIRRGGVIAYAANLDYADSARNHRPPDRYHGQWDLNLLDTLGTVGLVQPEINIHRSSARDLEWASGRVQLRITIVPSARHPGTVVDLEGTRLFPGTTYVWVDSLAIVGDSGTARALYIPLDSTRPIQRRLLQVVGTEPPPWNHAVARWTPAQCWTCVKFEWCH